MNNLRHENAEFIGRKGSLEQLQNGWKSSISEGKSTGKHSMQALVGLGGVGKTQIALAYAHTQQQLPIEQKPFFIRWLEAEDKKISSSLRVLAKDINPNLDEQTTDQEVLIYVYKQLKKTPRWLLIFDNVDKYESIKSYLPPSDCCQLGQHVLITSISEIWPNQFIKTIKISGFNEEESLNYFEQYFPGLNGKLRDEALSLAKELGYLPLAFSHATAYMQKRHLNIPQYRIEYHKKGLETLKVHPIDEALPYPHTVHTTWLMAIEQLEKICPQAIILLSYCAYLAPNIKRYELNAWLGLFNEDIFEEAVIALSNYSLVDIINIGSESELVFHQLVQAVTRDRQKKKVDAKLYLDRLIQVIEINFPDKFETGEINQSIENIFLHVFEIKKHAVSIDIILNPFIKLLVKAGKYCLLNRRNYFVAEELLKPAENYYNSIPETNRSNLTNEILQIYSLLSFTYYLMRSWDKADDYCSKAEDFYKKIYNTSENHKLAFIWRIRGYLFREIKKHEKAIEYFEKSLNILIKENNEIECATLSYALAYDYSCSSQYQKAIELCDKSSAILKRIFKANDHPQIAAIKFVKAMVISNKAHNMAKEGNDENYKEATVLLTNAENKLLKALNIYKQSYGNDHPDVAKTYLTLGLVQISLSKYEIAEINLKLALNYYNEMQNTVYSQLIKAYSNVISHLKANTAPSGQYPLRYFNAAIHELTGGKNFGMTITTLMSNEQSKSIQRLADNGQYIAQELDQRLSIK